MAEPVSFHVEPVNLREILAELREVDPKLANGIRREFRKAGDEIITAQRAALAKRPPRVGGSTKRLVLIRPRRGKPYYAFRRKYSEGATRTGGVSQLRAKISRGLRVRTSASARRQGIEFKTTGPRNGGANMARVFEKRMFRHPVFGRDGEWAPQFGQPYFFKPVTDEMKLRMAARINTVIDDAFASLNRKTTTT
jgi:hypothetical protein